MQIIIGSILFALALLFAGKGDYEEAQSQHRNYCIMIQAGYWPDFEQRDCGGVLPSDSDKTTEF
jgi:hypothetical protein